MSEKQPNWAEKAALASSILTNAQLQQVQSTLQTLGALQAEQVRQQLNEKQAKEREDRLREGLWQMETCFNNLVQDAAVTPSAMHVVVKQIQAATIRFGLATSSFRQLVDKDRVGQFLDRLQKAAEDSVRKLSPQEVADMETYFRYQFEGPILDDLIKRLQAQNTNLVETRRRRENAVTTLEGLRQKACLPETKNEEASRRRRSILAKIGIVIVAAPAGVAGLVGVFSTGIALFDFGSTDSDPEFWWVGLGAFLIAGIGTALCTRLNKTSKLEKTVRERIVITEGKIKKADAEIAKLESRVNDPLREEQFVKFQARDISQILRRKQERDSYMLQFRQTNGMPSDEALNLAVEASGLNSCRELSPEVQELASHAKKISAIMLHQKQTGASLAESKKAVEAFVERGE